MAIEDLTRVFLPVPINSTNLVSTTAVEAYPTFSLSAYYYNLDRAVSADGLVIYEALAAMSATVSGLGYSVGSPATFTKTAHGFAENHGIRLVSDAAELTWGGFSVVSPISVSPVTYYVHVVTADSFQLRATSGGSLLAGTAPGAGNLTLVKGSTAYPLTDDTKWVRVGPSNKWAMFGVNAGIRTTALETLTVVFRPGPINALAMFGLLGIQATVTMKDAPGGSVVYSATVSLDATPILDFYDYSFAPFVQRQRFALVDLSPGYLNPEVSVTLTGYTGQTVGASNLLVGFGEEFGFIEWGVSPNFKGYTIKTENAYGDVGIDAERGFKRLLQGNLIIDNERLEAVTYRLEAYRDKLCCWVPTTAPKFAAVTQVYGFLVSIRPGIEYAATSCDLQIEGIVQ